MSDSENLVELAPIEPDNEARDGAAGPDHPMRQVTRQVAFEGGWSPERAKKVGALFDSLAPEWHTRDSPERAAVVDDALARGGPALGMHTDLCIEVGSGTGFGTRVLAERFSDVVAVDLAWEMLNRAPADIGYRVQGDASALPVADGCADAIALVNALLFPDEVDRVLKPGGAVVWINTSGTYTPIHLSAEDVLDALPGSWRGVASQHGRGTWCVAVRD